MHDNLAAQWVLSHRWAITEEYLQTIIGIAQRQMGIDDAVRQAIAAKDGDPLPNARRAEIRDGVAIIPVIGPIFPRANLFTAFSGGTSIGLLAKDFAVALKNQDVKAIILNIDSPGGEVTGVSEFADMVYTARAIKPIIAYVYGYGASAAYWIASSASKVVASNTAEVGSIGVVSAWEDSREKDKKSGVQTIEIVSSFSPNKRPDPQTDMGKTQILKIVDDLALEFIGAVARNRGVSTDTVMKDFGQGDVFVGKNAVAARMIDDIGSLESVIGEYSSQYKGGLYMDLNELKAKHPDTYRAAHEEGRAVGVTEGKKIGEADGLKVGNEVGRTEGTAAERARIQGIESIAVPGAEAIIASNKFVPTATKESVSVLILENQKKVIGSHSADALELARQAAQVTPSAPAADNTKNAEADAVVDAAVAKANSQRKR